MKKYFVAITLMASLALCAQDRLPVAQKVTVRSWVSDVSYKPQALAGQPYLLEFWATWCGYCVDNMPKIERLYNQYSPKGLRVIGLSSDTDPALVKKFIKSKGIKHPIAIDTATKARYNINAIPAAVLVDAAGFVVWYGHPGSDELEAIIQRTVAASPMPVIADLDLRDFKDIPKPVVEGKSFQEAYLKLQKHASSKSPLQEKAKAALNRIDQRLQGHLDYAQRLANQEKHIPAINVYSAIVSNYAGTKAATIALDKAIELQKSI